MSEPDQLYPPPPASAARACVSGMAAYQHWWPRPSRPRAPTGLGWRASSSAGRRRSRRSLDDSEAPFFKWFEDGTLNVSYNCLDRQVERGLGDKVAIIFEADDGAVTPRQPIASCSRAPAAWPTR